MQLKHEFFIKKEIYKKNKMSPDYVTSCIRNLSEFNIIIVIMILRSTFYSIYFNKNDSKNIRAYLSPIIFNL